MLDVGEVEMAFSKSDGSDKKGASKDTYTHEVIMDNNGRFLLVCSLIPRCIFESPRRIISGP